MITRRVFCLFEINFDSLKKRNHKFFSWPFFIGRKITLEWYKSVSLIASNSAVVQPHSYPCLIATAPRNNPIPNIDFSIPVVSFRSLMESKCRIFPLNQTLTTPSALPRSLFVSKLVAVILKKGPNVRSWRSRFCALDASMISDIVGNSISWLSVFRYRLCDGLDLVRIWGRSGLHFWMGNCVFWIKTRVLCGGKGQTGWFRGFVIRMVWISHDWNGSECLLRAKYILVSYFEINIIII